MKNLNIPTRGNLPSCKAAPAATNSAPASARSTSPPINTPQTRRTPQRLPCHFDAGKMLYAAFLVPILFALFTTPAVAAATIWDKAGEIMKDVYTQILAISTIAAIVTASVALLMMNFSKNSKTVEESRAWLKRIIITWAILNGLGFIMAYVTPFFSGGQWTA